MAIADTLNLRITAMVGERNETCSILALGTTSLHTTQRFVAQNLLVVIPSRVFSPGKTYYSSSNTISMARPNPHIYWAYH